MADFTHSKCCYSTLSDICSKKGCQSGFQAGIGNQGKVTSEGTKKKSTGGGDITSVKHYRSYSVEQDFSYLSPSYMNK